jgi:hypothetical protein
MGHAGVQRALGEDLHKGRQGPRSNALTPELAPEPIAHLAPAFAKEAAQRPRDPAVGHDSPVDNVRVGPQPGPMGMKDHGIGAGRMDEGRQIPRRRVQFKRMKNRHVRIDHRPQNHIVRHGVPHRPDQDDTSSWYPEPAKSLPAPAGAAGA